MRELQLVFLLTIVAILSAGFKQAMVNSFIRIEEDIVVRAWHFEKAKATATIERNARELSGMDSK